MEYYATKTPTNHKLIRIVFYIILAATLTSLLLFFTLSINLTANASNGEIIAENTAIQYLTPMESQIKKVFVNEGDLVKEGDTLVILRNDQLIENLEKAKSSLKTIKTNIEIFQKQLDNSQQKLNRKKETRTIINNQHLNKSKGNELEVKKIKAQIDLLENKIKISKKRMKQHAQLLQKGAISRKEYDNRHQAYLDEINTLNQTKSEVTAKFSEQGTLKTDLAENLNNHDLNILDLELEALNQQKALEQEIAKEEQLYTTLNTLQEQLDQLNIIAEKEGYVVNLFNIKSDVNILPKNESILYVSPVSGERFYAKLLVSESDIKNIQADQIVHIRLKAYNHYQYGIIKAKVQHVDKQIIEQEEDLGKADFYVIAQISNEEAQKMKLKNGYKISGEVILDKVRFSTYVFNSMFKKINT